jgi:glycosyltransferase involved in cell wall biosynthesis
VFVDHETALLVPPDNADALADALEKMAHDIELRSRLGKAARDLIVTRFTIQKMLSETLTVYNLGR